MEKLKQKMDILTKEMETLIQEQGQIRNRSRAIEIRMNQLMGGLQILQEILQEENVAKATEAVANLADSLTSQTQKDS
jgi:hypothetical protein